MTSKLNGQEFLPPTSFNQWFAYENDYTAASLIPAVKGSAAAGLDYFCVDGGWFPGGFRNGIGNWRDGDPAKFPEGIQPFSKFVRENGLKYGIWFEPEFAHKDSERYQAHRRSLREVGRHSRAMSRDGHRAMRIRRPAN